MVDEKLYAASSLEKSSPYVDEQGNEGHQGLGFHGGPYYIIVSRKTPVEGRHAMYISRHPKTSELKLITVYAPPENSPKKEKASWCYYKKVESEELK